MIFKFLETLIPYINKNETLFCEKNTILFKVPFDINIIQNKCKLNSLKTYFEDNYSFDLKIKFFNSIQSNLGSLLIHNFKFPKTIVFKNTVCAKLNCEICKFISFDEFILLRNGFKLPVLCNGNCESKMSIYIIKCIKCNDLYIGKTELTIEKRMRVHLSMIKNFLPFKYSCRSDIEHFNLIDHNYINDLRFYIFKDDYLNTTELLLNEKILINFVSRCHNSVLNDYTPFINKCDHQLLFNDYP